MGNDTGQFICVECRQTFGSLTAAWEHTNPVAGKNVAKGASALRISMSKHVVFPTQTKVSTQEKGTEPK